MSQRTLWPLAPHTEAKHALLRAYLTAWFPILGSWNQRVRFIDGFAGPGEYWGGEPGSPLVALQAASTHAERLARRNLNFVLIEQDRSRYEHLQNLVNERQAAGEIPNNIAFSVRNGSFSEVINRGLERLGNNELGPTFVMIDPFGIRDVTYQVLQRLARYDKTELLISFMYESISRFMRTDGFEPHLDALFGCREWRTALTIDDSQQKELFLHDLFQRRLVDAGMEYVRSFRMIDTGGRTEYFLFFATHSIKGLEVMTNAMWSVDPSGGYRFSDATDPNQLVLIEPEPDFSQLRSSIVGEFKGQTVGIKEIEDYVIVHTLFRKTDIRTNALQPMEDDGVIQVTGRSRRRTYPPRCTISFA